MTLRTYPRLFLNLAAATLLVGTVAGQAQADTVWRFPPKGGAPYAVPHEHNERVTKAWKSTKQISKQKGQYAQDRHSNPSLGGRAGLTPRMRAVTGKASRPSLKISQALSADPSGIVVAHHKPGYHDGLPRTGKSAVFVPQRRSFV